MIAPSLSTLGPTDSEARERFERAFYEAFAPLPAQRLLRRIWDWDDVARRLRPRHDYDRQAVYLWHSRNGALLAAMAVNTAGQPFQFQAFGFAPLPGEETAGEILTLFSAGRPRLPGHAFTRRFIREGCFADLRTRGGQVLYTTCSDRPLPTYLRMGWSLLRSTNVEGEPRHLLRLELTTCEAGPVPAYHCDGGHGP